jgi:hypothetical protein
MVLHDGRNGGRMTHATQERELPRQPLWAPHGATTQRTTISRTQRKEKKSLPSRYSPPGCSFPAVPFCLTGEERADSPLEGSGRKAPNRAGDMGRDCGLISEAYECGG